MTHCLRYESADGASVRARLLGGAAGGRTFNGRVILVDEVALDQLDGQAGFTHASAADHHQLVFSEELGRRQPLGTLAGERGSRKRTLEAIVCFADGGARWVVRTPGACFAKGLRLGGGER